MPQLSEQNRALIERVFADDLPYTDREGMIFSEAQIARLLDAARQEGAYEPSEAEIREGESLDSVSYVIRKGETDQTAFTRAARAEIVRLRRALSERQEGAPAVEVAFDPDAHELVQTAQCLILAIEKHEGWGDCMWLVTARAHASVLAQDLPAALSALPFRGEGGEEGSARADLSRASSSPEQHSDGKEQG